MSQYVRYVYKSSVCHQSPKCRATLWTSDSGPTSPGPELRGPTPQWIGQKNIQCLSIQESVFSGSRADWMNSCLWVPSQYGGLAVYLQPHSQALESFSGMKRRGIRPWALVLWVPSQKGCFLLCPQVHHEWRFPPTSSTLKGFLEAMTGSLDRLESWTFGAVIIGHVQGCIKVAETNLRTLSDMIVFMFGCGCVLLIK